MGYPKADLVLRGGRVFRSLAARTCEAMAIWNGRVLGTGSDVDIDEMVGPLTRVVDLAGRLAVPGFNDAHEHLLSLGRSMMQISVKPGEVATMSELLDRVAVRAAAAAPGEWIFGGRYDHYQLDLKRHPLREELDLVAPDNPVYLKRTCGHMGVANSRALSAAGIDESTAAPPGGGIEQLNGRLTGLLLETAQSLVTSKLPPESLDTLVDAIEAAGRHMLSRGITSVMDAGVGGVQGFDDYHAYQRARLEARLPVRCYMALYGGPGGIMDECIRAGVRTGAGDERLKTGPAKLFTDGSAGGRTAAMTEPYLGDDDDRGLFVYGDEELHEWMDDYHRRGYQLAVHAIGDAAIEQTLNAYDRVLTTTPSPGRRHRIEHCGFPSSAHIRRMREHGIEPAPQPVFLYDFGDLYLDVLGDARPADSYPMRAWIDAGLHPAASSDAPVCGTDVMTNLYAMLTRRSSTGTTIGAGQRLTMAEAIGAYTYNGAFVTFSEHVKGTLAPGQLADVAVIEKDLFSIEPDEVLGTRIDLTLVEGEVVYDRQGEFR